MSMSRSWMVGAGCEWRHLFEEADRAVDTKVDGTSFGGRELESWSTNTSSYRREQFAATFTLSRRWSLARSERSLSLRWVEGLQDLLPRGEADIHHRAIQLVAGWSR